MFHKSIGSGLKIKALRVRSVPKNPIGRDISTNKHSDPLFLLVSVMAPPTDYIISMPRAKPTSCLGDLTLKWNAAPIAFGGKVASKTDLSEGSYMCVLS